MMSSRQNTNKRRATIDDKCFNCRRIRHFGTDCIALSTWKNNKTDESSSNNNSQQRWNNEPKRNWANIAPINTVDNDKSDTKPFRPGMANMAKDTHQQALKKVWYLNSYAFRHLTNNKDLFVNKLRPKYFDFTITSGQTLRTKSVGTIAIPLVDGSFIRLEGVAYVFEYNSNLILLGQLRDNNIIYVDNKDTITLVQESHTIAHVRKNQNLFIFDLVILNKVMQVIQLSKVIMTQGQRLLIYLISKNEKVQIRHERFNYASNTRIVRASWLLDEMGNFNPKYNPIKVYSNSEGSGLEYEDGDILPKLDTTSSTVVPHTFVPNAVV